MKLQKESLSKQEVKGMLAMVYNVAYSYLKMKFNNKPLLSELQTNPQEMAVEITALLFRSNGTNEILLNKKLNNHKARITDDTEFRYYLNRIVRETAESVLKFELLKNDLIEVEVGTIKTN